MAGKIYLIHFIRGLPLRRHPLSGREICADHYIGWSERLGERLEHHRKGSGSAIMAAVSEREIPWSVVRLWEGTRTDERALKQRREAPRFCPVCVAQGATRGGLLSPPLRELAVPRWATSNGPERVRGLSGPLLPKAGARQDMGASTERTEILPVAGGFQTPTVGDGIMVPNGPEAGIETLAGGGP